MAKWNAEKIKEAAMKEQEKRMGKAVQFVVRSVKISVNRSNRSGDSPSLPSEPPAKVSGRLQQSITGKVLRQGANDVVGVVGSSVPYARRLELGFFGSDSRGHKIRQGARPFLRPGVVDNLKDIKKILGGK